MLPIQELYNYGKMKNIMRKGATIMSKSKIIILAVVLMMAAAMAAGCSGGGVKATTETTTPKVPIEASKANVAGVDVSVEQALTMWQNKQVVIVDVRTPVEYQEGHIPSVANIPLDQLESRMNEVPKDKKVLLICRSGKRSAQGTALLRGKGFDNVYNVVEGMNGWKGLVEK
jgi:phage shock protein E